MAPAMPSSFSSVAQSKAMAFDTDTHRFLHWNLTHTPDDDDEDFHYLDIAKMLTEINRKSYRQGMSYDVANITFHDSDPDETFIKVCTAPNTWPTQAAWQLGFKNWFQQQEAAANTMGLDDLGPYSDFKVFLNPDHIDDPDVAVFVDSEGNTAPSGDWDYSEFKVPVDGSADPSDCKIVLMGAGLGFPEATRASLLREFEKVLNVPQEDPAVPNIANSLYAMLSPEASDMEVIQAVMDDIESDNDLPGYAADKILGAGGTAGAGVPTDPWVIRECCIPGGGAHMAAVGGFTAPCGLVCIETKQATDANIVGVTLELVPGDYKGVSARPMRGGGL